MRNTAPKGPPSADLVEIFLAVLPTLVPTENGCSEWPGGRTTAGYGSVSKRLQGRNEQYYAHRLAWFVVHGMPPEETPHVRHVVCNNPPCCNVDHLEPGTHAQNMADKVRAGRAVGWNSTKTHCPQGHPYDETNTSVKKSGARGCKQCARDDAMRRARERGVMPRSNHCPQGHEFTPENTRLKPQPNGGVARSCRECARIYSRERNQRRKEAREE